LARLPRELRLTQPGILVLELGANDGLQGLPVDLARQRLAEMIRLAQGEGAARGDTHSAELRAPIHEAVRGDVPGARAAIPHRPGTLPPEGGGTSSGSDAAGRAASECTRGAAGAEHLVAVSEADVEKNR